MNEEQHDEQPDDQGGTLTAAAQLDGAIENLALAAEALLHDGHWSSESSSWSFGPFDDREGNRVDNLRRALAQYQAWRNVVLRETYLPEDG